MEPKTLAASSSIQTEPQIQSPTNRSADQPVVLAPLYIQKSIGDQILVEVIEIQESDTPLVREE